MNIGSKLRYLIEEANITQRQLADALHISPSALNGYINQGKEPDYATLVRIADYFILPPTICSVTVTSAMPV